MDAILRNRILLGLAVLAALVTAFVLDGRATAGPQEMLAQLREHNMDETAARAAAKGRDLQLNQGARSFQSALDKDTEAFGTQPIATEALLSPNFYEHLVRDNVILKPGASYKSEWVEVRAAVEQIRYINKGAEIRANHSMVYVKNVRSSPIAYFLDVRSAQAAGCEVRGSRSHNSVALLPGEVAEIVVCAGRKAVEIHDLQVMELSHLGYMYVSQVPARAFGNDEIRGQSHAVPRAATRCGQVPVERMHSGLREGKVRWRDIADFYSRHNCNQYPWIWGYTFATAGLKELPVTRLNVDSAANAP